jgi:hypothetical protein
VSEFDTRFDKLYRQIPQDLHPTAVVVRLLYVNSFDGKFDFILRDKKPHTLVEAREYSIEIEENIICSKFDHFQYPCARVELNNKDNYKQCTRSNCSHSSKS